MGHSKIRFSLPIFPKKVISIDVIDKLYLSLFLTVAQLAEHFKKMAYVQKQST